jgi:hypothetical protein
MKNDKNLILLLHQKKNWRGGNIFLHKSPLLSSNKHNAQQIPLATNKLDNHKEKEHNKNFHNKRWLFSATKT